MTISPPQCRAARGLVGLSQADLASAAGVGISTVRDLETQRRQVSAEMVAAVRRALERAGVSFIPENGGGLGVRLAKRTSSKRQS